MITRPLLRALRNELPMPYTIRLMGAKAPYAKCVDGRYRFICPHCNELLATVNPRNNLAHCFNCGQNTNNIDLLRSVGYPFLQAVEILQKWLLLYRREASQSKPPAVAAAKEVGQGAMRIAQILRQDFGKDDPAA